MQDTIKVEFIPAKKWYRSPLWKLLEEYTSCNGNVTVPIGFITDGASIPKMAQRMFPKTGRYFGAAIIHDYLLYEKHDWDLANDEMDQEMKALDIARWRHFIIITAVRVRAWFHKKGIWKSDFKVKS